jgi:hypothetical protein
MAQDTSNDVSWALLLVAHCPWPSALRSGSTNQKKTENLTEP